MKKYRMKALDWDDARINPLMNMGWEPFTSMVVGNRPYIVFRREEKKKRKK